MDKIYTLWARAREAAVFLLRLRGAQLVRVPEQDTSEHHPIDPGQYWRGQPRVVAIMRVNALLPLEEVQRLGRRIYERHERFFVPAKRCAPTIDDALIVGRPFVEAVFRDYQERQRSTGQEKIERHQSCIRRVEAELARLADRYLALQFMTLNAFEMSPEDEA